VHWPEPIKTHFRGRGKVLGTGVALLAAAFGVAAFKLIGLAIFAASVAALVIVELWLESARLSREIGERDERIGKADEQRQLRDLEMEDLSGRASRLPALETEVARLENQVRDLREEMSSPVQSFEQLLAGLEGQVTVIDVVQKHRLLAQQGNVEWPVMRVEVRDDAVMFSAYVGDEAERFAGEWVDLIQTGSEDQGSIGQVVTAGAREIVAGFEPEDLPPAMMEELLQAPRSSPNGCSLRLSGLDLFAGTRDADLERLRAAAVALSDALAAVLTPGRHVESPAIVLEREDAQSD
jgi:hypothetical protein